MGFGGWGLGFRDLFGKDELTDLVCRLRVQGLGLRVEGLGLRVEG